MHGVAKVQGVSTGYRGAARQEIRETTRASWIAASHGGDASSAIISQTVGGRSNRRTRWDRRRPRNLRKRQDRCAAKRHRIAASHPWRRRTSWCRRTPWSCLRPRGRCTGSRQASEPPNAMGSPKAMGPQFDGHGGPTTYGVATCLGVAASHGVAGNHAMGSPRAIASPHATRPPQGITTKRSSHRKSWGRRRPSMEAPRAMGPPRGHTSPHGVAVCDGAAASYGIAACDGATTCDGIEAGEVVAEDGVPESHRAMGPPQATQAPQVMVLRHATKSPQIMRSPHRVGARHAVAASHGVAATNGAEPTLPRPFLWVICASRWLIFCFPFALAVGACRLGTAKRGVSAPAGTARNPAHNAIYRGRRRRWGQRGPTPRQMSEPGVHLGPCKIHRRCPRSAGLSAGPSYWLVGPSSGRSLPAVGRSPVSVARPRASSAHGRAAEPPPRWPLGELSWTHWTNPRQATRLRWLRPNCRGRHRLALLVPRARLSLRPQAGRRPIASAAAAMRRYT